MIHTLLGTSRYPDFLLLGTMFLMIATAPFVYAHFRNKGWQFTARDLLAFVAIGVAFSFSFARAKQNALDFVDVQVPTGIDDRAFYLASHPDMSFARPSTILWGNLIDIFWFGSIPFLIIWWAGWSKIINSAVPSQSATMSTTSDD